jgi:hypothetical protein
MDGTPTLSIQPNNNIIPVQDSKANKMIHGISFIET